MELIYKFLLHYLLLYSFLLSRDRVCKRSIDTLNTLDSDEPNVHITARNSWRSTARRGLDGILAMSGRRPSRPTLASAREREWAVWLDRPSVPFLSFFLRLFPSFSFLLSCQIW